MENLETPQHRGQEAPHRRMLLAAGSADDVDGIWLITLSDLLTLLLVFFIFCFLVARASGNREPTPQPRAAALPVAEPKAPTPWSGEGALLSAINALRLQNGVSVAAGAREMVITLKERVTFQPGRAEVLPTLDPLLDKIASVLRANPSAPVEIAGYTDNVPIHTSRYRSNWELSVARATSVLAYLIGKYRLDPSRFSVTGYADLHPLVPNDTPEHRAENRRVEIRLKRPAARSAGALAVPGRG